MASNFNYEEYLKEIIEKDLALEETQDHSNTLQGLFDSAITHFKNKQQNLLNLNRKRSVLSIEINSKKGVIQSLQERRLKLDEALKFQTDEITAAEKELEDMTKKYTETVDGLQNKLSTIENDFDEDVLKQKIAEIKKLEKDIEVDIAQAISRKQANSERLKKLNEEPPKFTELKKVRNAIFNKDKEEELAKKQRELDKINAFISEVESKLKVLPK